MDTIQLNPSRNARIWFALLSACLIVALTLVGISQPYLVSTLILLLISIYIVFRSTTGLSSEPASLTLSRHEWLWSDKSMVNVPVNLVRSGVISRGLLTAQLEVDGHSKSLFLPADALSNKDHWILRRQLMRGIVPLPESD